MKETQKQQRAYHPLELKSQRKGELWTALEPWKAYWQSISRRMAPRTGRFLLTDRNRGAKRHEEILDNAAIYAAETLANGFIGGACSPARPWHRSTCGDPELAQWQPVAKWFADVDQILRAILDRSNFYRARQDEFRQLGVFGIGAGLLTEDQETVIHHHPFELGEYALAVNSRGDIDTCYREYSLTTSQMVETFGWEYVSDEVRDAWNNGRLGHWWTVCHAIEPRRDRDYHSPAAKHMPWSSCYWEQGREGREQYLSESGFRRFPVIAPRWSVESGGVYGYGPGSFAFGDAGQLQHQQLRKGQVIDFGTAPPLQGPNSRSNDEISFLPGGYTQVDQPGTNPIVPIWTPTVPLSDLMIDIADVRNRIDKAFFVDMFLMLARSNDIAKTATEIAERSEEKLIQVAPVVSRVNNESLEPTLRFAFETALSRGMLPPPPEELDGQPIKIEFTSVFAQAQKLVGIAQVDRWIGTLNVVSGMNRQVLQKVDWDAVVDGYSDMLGIHPKFLLAADRVAALRESEAQALAAKEQSAMIAEQAGAMRNLAGAQTGQGSALDLMGQLSGYNSPTASQV